MANLQLIKHLAEKHNLPITELAKKVGLKEQQIHVICRTNSTKIETLEKIASVLGVHPGYFFDECEVPATGRATALDHSAASINGNATVHVNASPPTSTPADAEKIAHLEALLAEKERAIQDKERTIQILLNK